jgi:probable HAF family extracellular repeat protein
VNDHGWVVGVGIDPETYVHHGLVWTDEGVRTVRELAGDGVPRNVYPRGVSDANVIVGTCRDDADVVWFPTDTSGFLMRPAKEGKFTFDRLEGVAALNGVVHVEELDATVAWGSRLVESGHWEAVVFGADPPVGLGTLGGARSEAWGGAVVRGKAGRGWKEVVRVVGESRLDDGSTHAFLWTSKDGMTDLGGIEGHASAQGVNRQGIVVGATRAHRANRWTKKGVADLNDLVDAEEGWHLTAAYDIDPEGHIVGEGSFRGKERGFLLRPAKGSPGKPAGKDRRPHSHDH